MSPRRVLAAAALVAALAGACGRNQVTGGRDGGSGAAGAGGGTGARAACLDQPTDLPTPPGDRLPCDLIPPGLDLSPQH